MGESHLLYLSVFLCVVGVIMILLGIFSFRTATYKNESRGLIIGLMAAAVIMIGIGGAIMPGAIRDQHQSKETPPTQQRKQMSSMTSHNNNLVFDAGQRKQAAARRQLNEANVEKTLVSSYRKLGKISFNVKTRVYTLTITNSNFNKAMTYLKANPSQSKTVRWPASVKGFTKTSLVIKKTAGSGYKFRVVAPIPSKQTLLTVEDGKVLENFVKE
ncbi:hypothetical protein [Lentilactobacillus kisonensis]|uniref:DUF308 domain-containing protein n=2 Tax=Lentilactobacillus kisonensis TaxID=481722 RepID=H1LHV9_9LACO|nr:hypothetical protein [Lentilactobacillus kisonensis]EHO50195.1 hypothetical protein HMPREF9104_02200 [Lentilactobacillus kisonensis F0435]KRL20837.1 hypothetical protein FC98_GL001242 [Lentilactobacillus kisonensis DSM 19906 = JCM 15041]